MHALLTLILSFAGALACGLMPAGRARQIRWVALAFASLGLLTALHCALRYGGSGVADEVDWPWIPSLGARLAFGYDGISLPLLLVTGLVAVCGVLFTWELKERANEFYAYYFALVGGVYGVFLSRDLFLLFVFYEIAVVPKYFLIAIWGGTRKDYAAMKLVLYSFAGSALVLLGLLGLYFGANASTFTLQELSQASLSAPLQYVVFPLLFVGFAVLAGMWPFHTWAPTGHVAAPTAASMLLAGVVMKLGAYGCLRVAIGLLPLGAKVWAPWVAALAVVNIVYGALVALRQTDFKFVIGYSSVSHMGFVLLGLATLTQTGLTGAVLQMFSHGVIGALLFALVGAVIYSRTHTRQLEEFHLLIARMPVIAWVFILAGLASMGLPGFSGFAAELHVLMGAWQSPWVSAGLVVLAGAGVVATFGYTLVKIHEAFFRPRVASGSSDKEGLYEPMTAAEIAGCALLLGSSLLVGLFPSLLTDKMQASLKLIVDRLNEAR